jgi:heme exporter protein B
VLSLDRLFAADHADGGLDLIALSSMPLEMAVLAKGAAHWLTTGLPLVVVSPVLALFVDLDPRALPVLALGLLLGTPAMSLIGAIAAALSLGARRPGVLMTLLVLPLYLPPLIFGTAAVEASLSAEGARAHLLLLAALTLASLPLAPFAAAAALKQALD